MVQINLGKHELWAAPPAPGRSILLNAIEKQIYYVKVGYDPIRSWASPFAGDPYAIKLISEEEAREL